MRITLVILSCLIFYGCLWIYDTNQTGREKILNVVGTVRGYGGCSHCGDTWNWKDNQDIMYNENSGAFPLCKECFNKMTYPYILWYYLAWFEKSYNGITDEQLDFVSRNIAQKKESTPWHIDMIRDRMYKNGKLIGIKDVKQ